MILVGASDALNALHRGLVADMAAQGVTRIGRINHHPAAIDDGDRLLDQTALWIVRMDLKKLGHDLLDSTRLAIIQDLIGKKTTFEKITQINVLVKKTPEILRKSSHYCYIYTTNLKNVVFFQKPGLLLRQF